MAEEESIVELAAALHVLCRLPPIHRASDLVAFALWVHRKGHHDAGAVRCHTVGLHIQCEVGDRLGPIALCIGLPHLRGAAFAATAEEVEAAAIGGPLHIECTTFARGHFQLGCGGCCEVLQPKAAHPAVLLHIGGAHVEEGLRSGGVHGQAADADEHQHVLVGEGGLGLGGGDNSQQQRWNDGQGTQWGHGCAVRGSENEGRG